MDIYRKIKLKEKRPPGREPKFTSEYMILVARKVVDEGMTYREASKVFGVSQGGISQWVKKYKSGDWGGPRGKKPDNEANVYQLEEQVKELKTEIGDLYLENVMLKKVLSHFRWMRKGDSSVITSENLGQFQKGVE